MSAECDVVVVGAGIGGAVLGLALGQRGWKVKLLERELEPRHIARPEILWGPTPAALDSLGVGELIRTRVSVRISGVEVWQGSTRRLYLSRQVMRAAGVQAYSTDPGLTRATIAEAAMATGCVSVVRGAEVNACVREGEQIVGVQGSRLGTAFEERARLIVGDDGAQSIVRQSIGPSIDLKLFPLDFVTASLRWPPQLPPDRARIAIRPAGLREEIPVAGLIPWPEGRGVLLMPMPHDRVAPLLESHADAFWSKLAKVSPLADELKSQLRFPQDFKHVRRPYGHAPQYVADGAAIIGDAAHPMSPAGGQGANASIWDALALAEVAHEALSAGDVSRQRLSRYESLRRPRNADSVRITQIGVRTLNVLSHLPAMPRLIPLALAVVDSLPWLKGRILAAFSRTFVTR